MTGSDSPILDDNAPLHDQGISAIVDDMPVPSDLPDIKINVDDDDTSSLSFLPSDDEDMSVTKDKDDSNEKGKKRCLRSTEDSTEDDSDHKQTKKKMKKSNTSKKTKSVNTKKETKKDKGEGKGKSKVIEESDDEQDKQVKKGKKQLLSKKVVWKDIPDWKERNDCPLLELPVEVLDLIFAPSSGLMMRDYIALAGVSRIFRLRFTPEFFHVLACLFKLMVGPYTSVESEAASLRVPLNRSIADRIFSRDVEDWRVYPSKVSNIGTLVHYVPDGPRQRWSQAQYIVYKEEQRKCKIKAKEMMRVIQVNAAVEAEKAREKYHKTVKVNSQNRTILAVIQGRDDGHPPIEKDAKGLPIAPPESKVEAAATPLSHVGPLFQTGGDEGEQSPVVLNNETWTVPDSSEDEEDELEPRTEWDESTGEKVVFDCYPSKWRKKLVEEVQEKHINRTNAMSKYKVTEAELLCLKCTLVPNPMSSTSPQQIYSEAAVEALAYRSHGGPAGHSAHLKTVEERAEKAGATRVAKIEKAKADGTYVKKQKRPYIPPYEWGNKDRIYARHDRYCTEDYCVCYQFFLC